LAVQWLNEALCFVSSFVVADPPSVRCGRADSLVLRNRQLLVAAKRYWLPKKQALQKKLTLAAGNKHTYKMIDKWAKGK